MSRVMIVAWREFTQTVLRPVFLIAVLGIPVLMVGVIVVAGFIIAGHEEPPLIGTVVVADDDGEVAEAARKQFNEDALRTDQLEQTREQLDQLQDMSATDMATGGMGAGTPTLARGEVRIEVAPRRRDDTDPDTLRELVRTDADILAAAIIPTDLVDPANYPARRDQAPATDTDDRRPRATTFELFVSPDLDLDHAELIERRLGQAVVDVRAERSGLDVAQARRLLDRPAARTKRVLEGGGETEENDARRLMREFIPMIFMMLLWVATFTAGQRLLMSTIEESSNRVMEVLLSSVSPLQLMTGKIIGHGAVGLLIISIYLGAGLGMLVFFSAMDVIDTMALVYLGLYFFMAYFMVASLMAAVGSAVTDIQEANTLITPVMLILMIPLMLWVPITQAPNGPIAVAFSFVPPAIPFSMILRIPADEPVPFWQIPATLVWGYLCTLFMVWFAAKIFRVGILMMGKPPSLLEMIRWARYS